MLTSTQTRTLKDKQSSTKTAFSKKLEEHGSNTLRSKLRTVQVNMGKLCNQACLHCHVDAGPTKTRENMTEKTVERLLSLLQKSEVETVDITGGAPELNPNFRSFVKALRGLNIHVMDRCNLTVLSEPGQEDTAAFLAEHQVEVVASLPCYSSDNVDAQRGDGVFKASIKGLQMLNALGYGSPKGPQLNLVYNPIGASLPPEQTLLEKDYKKRLQEDFGIAFNHLYCITNMPIKRFLFDLKRQGKEAEYRQLLLDAFNPHSLDQLMCRQMVSVGWDGGLYDCDFNQMLQLPLGGWTTSIWDVEELDSLAGGHIAVGEHCFGCTAGSGSSCGGSLTG